nr:hypothetical protein [Tanacetum cinerariifolium]
LGWRFKDFKGMSFEEIEAKFAQVWKQIENFTPMGSKEEAERAKRKGIILEKEQVKKQKSSEEAPKSKTPTEEGGSVSAMGSREGVSQHQTSIK